MSGSGGDDASAASLAAIRARQAKWMRERQAEMDREDVMQELEQAADLLRPASSGIKVGVGAGRGGSDEERRGGAGYGGDGSASMGGEEGGGGAMSSTMNRSGDGNGAGARGGLVGGGFKPEQVINRLTERITDRLRDELRVELQKEQADIGKNAAAMGRHVEGVLASEIASHTCPICYDLMTPPDNSPTMLFPCGHTFCAQCLKSHVDTHGKKKCPYCRQDISSQALNMSLQQIIQNFVNARDKIPEIRNGRLRSLTAGGACGEKGSPRGKGRGGGQLSPDEEGFAEEEEEEEELELAPSEMEMMYTQRMRTVSVRCRILRNELADIEDEREEIRARSVTASTVLTHLRGEEGELKGRLQGIMKELEVVREQVEEQERRVVDVAAEEDDSWRRRELVEKTLEPLEEELRKVSVLLEHVAPGVAATLA